jgi:hypothetical protein
MITENNVMQSIKDSVTLADVNPKNFESTVQFIHRQYEIVLKAKEKEIEDSRKEILHLRKMVESLAKKPIIIPEEIHIESIKNSVNFADVSPENFESTVQFIHQKYEIVLKAKDKEIEEYHQEILHLRKMVESLAKEPITIPEEIHNELITALLNQTISND